VAFICTLLSIYFLILLLRAIASWFPPPTSPVLERAVSILWALTEPVLRPLRGLLPPVRMGGMALDMSVLIVFFGLYVVRAILC
jgi:YggT family protein